jgi:hypothetical protein
MMGYMASDTRQDHTSLYLINDRSVCKKEFKFGL